MNVKDGEVVVIRNGDVVRSIFYREYYSSIEEFIEEIEMYLSVNNFENPNLSFMEIVDSKFTILPQNGFYREFVKVKKHFNIDSSLSCKFCGTLNFLYLKDSTTYCPNCKKKS